jgi:hypothetical protein
MSIDLVTCYGLQPLNLSVNSIADNVFGRNNVDDGQLCCVRWCTSVILLCYRVRSDLLAMILLPVTVGVSHKTPNLTLDV